ncbi:MAG: MarR family winged helix-turn-helix transcriptional regulator [Rubrimonas sp.]|uniref:MarR family winged helix-turn-helix transcriptional regulator n=1 Tax=Rubrimonas sp. TaxID=2036015 RepID=UPI002FDD0538
MEQERQLRAVVKAGRRIARAFDVQSHRIDRAVGLTLPQLIVLGCIRDLGEVASRTLSVEADLSPPTVVGVLDKLEAKGLIARYRSTRDRRLAHARVTEKGRAALDAAPAPLGEAFAARFAALDPQARSRILEALEDLARLLGDAAAPVESTPEGAQGTPGDA